MVSRDIIYIREFREIREIKEVKDISAIREINDDAVGLGFVVSLSAYLTFKVSFLCIYLGALFKSIFFVRQISIMIGRKETIMRCEWFTSSVIFCIMEKNLLLLCGVCVASERCVRYELLDLTYKYSH